MKLVTVKGIENLLNNKPEPCVSLYLPTHRTGREVQQNPIRFKNLLRKAEKRLKESGLRSLEIQELLEPAENLVEDEYFWQHQSEGLAMFISSENFIYYRLPLTLQENVMVSHRFHVKPLLQMFDNNGRFFLLALSQNDIRLLECTRFNYREIELPDVPHSLEEALRFDDPERQIQFHTETSSGSQDRPAMFHGQGVGSDDARRKKDILRFFQALDKGVRKALEEQEAPLMLAGVDYLLPIYREANHYPHLLEQKVAVQPEQLGEEELHRRAWKEMEPLFAQARREALQQYHEKVNEERVSNEVTEIVPAAFAKRVDTLFAAADRQLWGQYDPNSHTFEITEKEGPGYTDALDIAAVQTLLNGGTVYVMESAEIPGEVPAAAIFRF